jgi:hypothetical protein
VLGEAVSEKSGVATTTVTVVECVRAPLMPVMVSVYDPTGVLAELVTERVDDEVDGFGEKLPVIPVGNPLTLNVTWPLKPTTGFTVTL